MKSLITLIQCEDGARVSSRLICEQVGVKHEATIKLIKKHKTKLETLGLVEFRIRAKSKTGQEKHALLNEDQAIFLLTLSRNTEQVVEFKLALTEEFSKLRRKQAIIDARHASVEWQQNRELGILTRRDVTDTIQKFVDYAKAQGSRGAAHYFTNITKLVNTALSIDARDEVSEENLDLLASAEYISEQCLLKGMSDQLPYKAVYQGLKYQMNAFAKMLEGSMDSGRQQKAAGQTAANHRNAFRRKQTNNSISAQRQIILKHLQQDNSLTTLEARVQELRQRGHNIITHWRTEANVTGKEHRIAEYMLFQSREST